VNKNLILKARFLTLGLAIALLPFSVRFCHLALLLFCIICLAEGDFTNKIKDLARNPIAWILPAFFAIHLFGVLYSVNISNAWANVDKKIAFVVAPLIIASTRPFGKSELRQFMVIFVVSCFAATVVCLANSVILSSSGVPLWNFGPQEPYVNLYPGASNLWPYFSYMGLSSGIGLHPTYFALYLLTSVLILVHLLTSEDGKILHFKVTVIGLIIYGLAFITLLSSRIVVLATALSMIVVLIRLGPQLKLAVAAGAVVVMAGVLLINPVARYRNTQEYTQTNFSWPPAKMSDNPISIRTSLWWVSFNALPEVNPIIGNGTGDVNDTMIAVSDRFDVHNVLNTSDPHNQYLHTYIALGTLGLVALLATFLVPLWIFSRQGNALACLAIISFMIVCMTESALELQKGIVFFSLFIAFTGNQLRQYKFKFQELRWRTTEHDTYKAN
jgi:O-antigen ligase